jgi:GDPmannose 4,6-dehydratase
VGDVIVEVDPKYFRPTEVETLLGDPSLARDKLGWEPETTLEEMVSEMVTHDRDQAERLALLKRNGYEINLSQE